MSCGVADLIATCFGGRNRLCGQEFVKRRSEAAAMSLDSVGDVSHDSDSNGAHAVVEDTEIVSLWSRIEVDCLHGQKLEGIGTCRELGKLLLARGNRVGDSCDGNDTAAVAEDKEEDEDEHNRDIRALSEQLVLFRSIHEIAVSGVPCTQKQLFRW